MQAVEQILGAVLMLVVLLDVFLTVLYARGAPGILSRMLARWTWQLFRHLSICGPVILVLLLLSWSVLLSVAAP